MDLKLPNTQIREHSEPQPICEATHHAVKSLDANYDKADLIKNVKKYVNILIYTSGKSY